MEESAMSEKKEPKIWTTKVVEEEETGELVILFPDDLMSSVGWKEGDMLAWVMSDDGMSCYIRKLQSPED
jgi:hypothetical protein